MKKLALFTFDLLPASWFLRSHRKKRRTYDFREVDINTSSPEGQLITQASESEDTAEKIQLLETFVEKFSDDYASRLGSAPTTRPLYRNARTSPKSSNTARRFWKWPRMI